MAIATLFRSALRTGLRVLPLVVCGGCSSPSRPDDCPPPHPTFRVTVSCLDGPVPSDVLIEVTYGGGVEEFDAQRPDDTPKSVFCTIKYGNGGGGDASAEEDGGSDAAIDQVYCELWTDTAAKVRLRASGYPDLERELSAESNECGLMMTDETLVLERAD